MPPEAKHTPVLRSSGFRLGSAYGGKNSLIPNSSTDDQPGYIQLKINYFTQAFNVTGSSPIIFYINIYIYIYVPMKSEGTFPLPNLPVGTCPGKF